MLKQLKAVLAKLTTPQKVLAASVILLVVAVLVLSTLFAAAPEPVLLHADVERKEASKIIAKLEEAGIKVRLENDGRNILVPALDADRARSVLLAADLAPSSGGSDDFLGSGFSFKTEAEQKVQLRMAKERELSRSLKEFAQVESATVHLVARKETYHKSGEQPAKASIILGLKRGAALPPSTAEAMTRLVANAVEGLLPENVTIMDTRGMVLAGAATGEGATLTRTLQRTQEVERYLTDKAESLLAEAFGPGKAVVRVNADLDAERRESREKKVDPTSKVVVKEKVSKQEQTDGTLVPGGRPGPKASPAVSTSGQAGGGTSTTEDLENAYEYNRTETTILKEMGAIKRLTVGVLVDKSLEPFAKGIEKSVKEAIGFSESRSDSFELDVVGFAVLSVADTAADEKALGTKALILDVAKYGVSAVLGIGILLFLRGMLKRAQRGFVAALETEPSREKPPPDDARAVVSRVVQQDPASVGRILKNWLYEPAAKN